MEERSVGSCTGYSITLIWRYVTDADKACATWNSVGPRNRIRVCLEIETGTSDQSALGTWPGARALPRVQARYSLPPVACSQLGLGMQQAHWRPTPISRPDCYIPKTAI
uniref:Uncharacterized protein n=1 Tax=Bionectria ochroleuca TaxID=29856 RepID=A0A8H7MZP4_BIOOC